MFVVTGGKGGWDYDGVILDSTETFDPLLGSWASSGQSGAKLPRPMFGLRAEIIDGRLLFFGITINKFLVIIPIVSSTIIITKVLTKVSQMSYQNFDLMSF